MDNISFPTPCVLINEGGNHREIIKESWRATYFICSWGGEPFVLPNVYKFPISNSPPKTPSYDLQVAKYASLSVREIASKLRP